MKKNVIQSREIPLHSSGNHYLRQCLNTGRSSKCFRTMCLSLANYSLLCRAVRVTWVNSLHIRYSSFLLCFQTLASFICQAQNLTYCNVLSSLGTQSHPQAMTVISWMEQSLFTASPLLEWEHLISNQMKFSSLACRSSCRIPKGWMLYGTHTSQAVWTSPSAKGEDKVFEGKCQIRQSYQLIG